MIRIWSKKKKNSFEYNMLSHVILESEIQKQKINQIILLRKFSFIPPLDYLTVNLLGGFLKYLLIQFKIYNYLSLTFMS